MIALASCGAGPAVLDRLPLHRQPLLLVVDAEQIIDVAPLERQTVGPEGIAQGFEIVWGVLAGEPPKLPHQVFVYPVGVGKILGGDVAGVGFPAEAMAQPETFSHAFGLGFDRGDRPIPYIGFGSCHDFGTAA